MVGKACPGQSYFLVYLVSGLMSIHWKSGNTVRVVVIYHDVKHRDIVKSEISDRSRLEKM